MQDLESRGSQWLKSWALNTAPHMSATVDQNIPFDEDFAVGNGSGRRKRATEFYGHQNIVSKRRLGLVSPLHVSY
jgi:hypothetical protein